MKSLLFLLALAPFPAFAAPISVRVTDEAGAPVEGATVQVQRVDKVKTPFTVETSDAQGLVKYELNASKSNADYFGRVIAWKAGSALSGGVLFKLPDGALTLKLGTPAALSGVVTDANGPVEGAVVQIRRSVGQAEVLQLRANSPLAQKLEARTDAQGRFALEGVPNEAQLQLSVTNEKHATQKLNAKSGETLAVKLQPGAIIGGQVLNAKGAPLAGLQVYVQNLGVGDGDAIQAEDPTDASGNYRLTGIAGGTYNVVFVADPDDEFVVEARENVAAVAGAERTLETARAIAGVLVRGRVIDAETQAGVAGIGVRVFGPAQPLSSEYISAVGTDDEGNFKVRLVPGANRITVAGLPQKWVDARQEIALDIAADAPAQPLTFELQPAVALRGRIVDENGKGVETRVTLKRERQEWPLQSDVNGDFSTYPNLKGEVTAGRSSFSDPREEDGDAIAWEAAPGQKFVLPSVEPLTIRVRRAQVITLAGRAEDEKGAPIEGVKLNISLAVGEGLGSTSRWETVVSDAAGRFSYPKVRADQTVQLRSIEKLGYDLQNGGEISRDGENWKVRTVTMSTRRNQIAGRVTLRDGAPAAGARVFAAGSEARADASGSYVLPILPAGTVDVLVYAAGQFGFKSAQTVPSATAATATDLKLSPQGLQPTDRELAGEMIARARVLAAQSDPESAGRLKLSDADPVGSLEALIATPLNGDQMAFSIYRSAGNPDVSTPLLLRAVRSIGDARWRLYAATMLFAKRSEWPDDDATRELVANLARDADVIAADNSNKWLGSIDLIGIAPLIERYEGEDAGREAMARAIAWVKTQEPQTGDGNTGGYLSTLAAGAELIAANSPALFAQLLEAIGDTRSQAYPRAMQQGIAAIAKARGLAAAAPFLRQLRDMPRPQSDDMVAAMNTDYAVRQATREAIELGGASAPELALQLARDLGKSDNPGEDEGARALAEAAFFQSPAVAAGLWRETLPQLNADRAAQIAIRVMQTRPELGAELLELARQQLETGEPIDSWGNSIMASFAFYEAKADAARARYRLEKAWWDLQGKSDVFQNRADLVRAMSAIDGERAFEWATLLPSDGQYDDLRIDALRQAARYIEASGQTRTRVDFERWRRDSTVFMD